MKKATFIAGVLVAIVAFGFLWRREQPAPGPAGEHAAIPRPSVDAGHRGAAAQGFVASDRAAPNPGEPQRRAQKAPPAPAVTHVDLRQVLPELAAPLSDWRTFAPKKLVVCPLPGLTMQFTATRITAGEERTIWVGAGGDQGVTLVASGSRDRWDAVVTIPGALEYNIAVSPAGVTVIKKDFGEEACANAEGAGNGSSLLPETLAADALSPPIAADTAPLTADLLILCTTATRNAFGGQSAAENILAARMATANTYLAQSQVTNIEWRLVGVVEASSYTETGDLGTDLNNLRSSRTTLGAFAKQQGDLYGADQVMLMVTSSSGNLAGIASAPGMFSVVIQAGSAGIMAHELGHNFGCQHDRQQAEIDLGLPPGALDNDGQYYYGYRFTASGRDTGTIMSYASFRLPYFSNPSLTYQGIALGVPAGQPRAADNHRVLIENAAAVAGHRAAVDQIPVITQQPASVTVAAGQSFSLSVTAAGNDLTYQWAHDGAVIAGATASSYARTVSTTADSGSYTVTVSNPAGGVQSAAATVTINAGSSMPPVNQPSSSGGGGGAFDEATALAVLALLMTARRGRIRWSIR